MAWDYAGLDPGIAMGAFQRQTPGLQMDARLLLTWGVGCGSGCPPVPPSAWLQVNLKPRLVTNS